MSTNGRHFTAAGEGHVDVVKVLLQNGAGANAVMGCCEKCEYTAPSQLKGRADVAKVLIQSGADVNALANEALHFAAQDGHADVANVLIQNGDVNAVNKGKETASFRSLEGHADVAKVLIQAVSM